ncbi:MAG: PIN domain-containing protein [Succinivibrio sp.]|nr:PIN domain-containing protein [Succinivibrio sp.]
MKKILVVIDTNVLVSAAYNLRNYDTEEASKRHCNVLLEKPAAGEIIPVVNELIVSEYQRKIAEEKFSFSSTLQEQIINSVLTYALNLDNPREVEERLPDPSDTIFYKVITDLCGSYADSYLTTGNLKHFPLQARNLNIVVNPKTLLMILDDYKNINTCLDRINYLNQNGWQMITENIACL